MIPDPTDPGTPDTDAFVKEYAGADPARALAELTDRHRQQERIMRHLATALHAALTFPEQPEARQHGIKLLAAFQL